MTEPRRDPWLLTPGPKKTFGSTRTSRPIFVSWLNQTVSGATKVAPSAIAAARRLSCQVASAPASSARLLMPSTSATSTSMATDRLPSAAAIMTMSGR